MKSITRFTKNIRGNKCLNCENDISEEDNFCSRCGQVNDLKKVSLKQYLSAYFDDFLSFDGRLLNTVVALIFKPGYVTKNYVEGRRISYVNPFRLYINITILFFLLLVLFSTYDQYKPGVENSASILDQLDKDEAMAAIDSIKIATLKELKNPDLDLDSSAIAAINNGINLVDSKIDEFSRDTSVNSEIQIKIFVDSLFSKPDDIAVLTDSFSTVKEKDSVMRVLMEPINDEVSSLVFSEENISINDWSKFNTVFDQLAKRRTLKRVAARYIEKILEGRGVTYHVPESIIDSDSTAVTGSISNSFFMKIKNFMENHKFS